MRVLASRVRVRLLDRRAGTAHEAGLRQGVAHVAGDDVAPVREHAVAVARLGGHELLDRGEDDATAGDAKLLAQVGPVGGLDGILARQITMTLRSILVEDPTNRGFWAVISVTCGQEA